MFEGFLDGDVVGDYLVRIDIFGVIRLGCRIVKW